MNRADSYIQRIMNSIVEITYHNRNINNLSSIIRLREKLKELEDKLVYDINVSARSSLLDEYCKVQLDKQGNNVYDTISYFKEHLENRYKHDIFDKINDISSIKYIHNNSVIEVRLKNGCVHCDYDVAFHKIDGDYILRPIYALYGQFLEYDDWNRHIEIRKNKIRKIKYKNGFKSRDYIRW